MKRLILSLLVGGIFIIIFKFSVTSLKFKGFKQSIANVVILPARWRAGIGGFLEHSRPSGTKGRISMMRAERVLQCANDYNFDIINATCYKSGDITLPRPAVYIAGSSTINDDFGDATEPVGQ